MFFLYIVFLLACQTNIATKLHSIELTHLKIFWLLHMLSLQKYDIQQICDTKNVRKSDRSQILLEKRDLGKYTVMVR